VTIKRSANWDSSGEPQKAFKSGKSDFVTTAMHEVIHGMAFLGTADIVDDEGKWGDEDGDIKSPKKVTMHSHCRCGAVTPLRRTAAKTSTAGVAPDVYDTFVANG